MKSLFKILILAAITISLGFVTGKKPIPPIPPIQSKTTLVSYPHPNIDTAYIDTYFESNGKTTLRRLQMYCKLKDYEFQVVEIMFKVRIFRVTNPSVSWYIYPRIKIYSLAGADSINLGDINFGFDVDFNDWEVWSYCYNTCG